jgi:hypothetical protein
MTNKINGSAMVTKGNKNLLKIAKTGDFEFNKLLADENFVNLLRAETLSTMPKYLWDKLGTKHKEAA